MYTRGKFEQYVAYVSLNREEFERYIVRVLWNEENAKKLLREKLGMHVSYIKIENFDYEVMAYFNCVLHNKLKYFIRIQRAFTHPSVFDEIPVYMQTDGIPCECLKTRYLDEIEPVNQKKPDLNEISEDQASDYVENGTTIQVLPPSLLQEILLYVPNKMDLRLVSKAFQNVIDNSSKLLKDQWLILDNVLDVDPSTINCAYQKLMIHSMGAKEMNWISKYQHKNRIKAIKFTSGDRCPIFMQYIISSFDSLEFIDFDLDQFYDEKFHMRDDMRLVPNKRSKLEVLHIGYYQNKQFNILEMFANITTIKKLYIFDFDLLTFPKDVKWKLEKLAVSDMPPDEYIIQIDEENLKEFLISQQMSLKDIRLHDNLNYSDFIIKNLPNLERLTLSMEEKDIHSINNDFLISDFNLKHFTFNYLTTDQFPILKKILKHYKSIKYLCLSSNSSWNDSLPWISSNEIHFENLSHLLLKSAWTFIILKAKMPKLKFLGLTNIFDDEDDDYNLANISNENVKNVEKASLKFCKLEDILVIVRKCPKLSHLNVDVEEWREKSNLFISQINDIIAALPQLKCLGICKWSLNKQNIEQKEVTYQVINKNVILKVYDDFPSMLDEDWDQEFPDFLDSWYFC